MFVSHTVKGQSRFTQAEFSSEGWTVSVEPKDLGLKDPATPEEAAYVDFMLARFVRSQALALQVRTGVISLENYQYQMQLFDQAPPPPKPAGW